MNVADATFGLYSDYYDLFNQNKDYAGEAEYVLKQIAEYRPGIRSALELGSGTGSYSSQICKRGILVTGLEKSQEMLQLAINKSIPGFRPLSGDIRAFNLDEQFDAVVSLFHVISYLTADEEVKSCFDSTHRHLKPGGVFLFDVWHTPAVIKLKPESRVKRIITENINVVRHAEPVIVDERVVEVTYDIVIDPIDGNYQIVQEKHLLRHFTKDEIESFATKAGFMLMKAEEFYTGNSPSQDTWGVCYILQKA